MMEKYTLVQVEVALTADEKALFERYAKKRNQEVEKKYGAAQDMWTLENVLQDLLGNVIYQAAKHNSVRAVWRKLS